MPVRGSTTGTEAGTPIVKLVKNKKASQFAQQKECEDDSQGMKMPYLDTITKQNSNADISDDDESFSLERSMCLSQDPLSRNDLSIARLKENIKADKFELSPYPENRQALYNTKESPATSCASCCTFDCAIF